MISCVITTTSSRTIYLNRTVESLKLAGLSPQISHADSGIYLDWLLALGRGISTGSEFVMVCQDDTIYCRGINEFLKSFPWPENCGCLSLYTSAKDIHGKGAAIQTAKKPWGACCYVFPRSVAISLQETELAECWISEKQVDQFVPQVIHELGFEFWSCSPSLCQHIGDQSTVVGFSGAAAGWRAAGDFVGENYDAIQYGCHNLPA